LKEKGRRTKKKKRDGLRERERDKGSYQVVNRLLPFLFQDPKLEEEEAIQFAEFGAQVGAVEEKPDERSGSARLCSIAPQSSQLQCCRESSLPRTHTWAVLLG
jgi:hypothetical protein